MLIIIKMIIIIINEIYISINYNECSNILSKFIAINKIYVTYANYN